MTSKWYDHLPAPVSRPAEVSVLELHDMMKNRVVGKDFLVVDVRRTDIEEPNNHVINNAINLPAQTFHQTLPGIYSILSPISAVIFHCSSSKGRGPRCAAWFQDKLDEMNNTSSKAFVLTGGINAWVQAFPDEIIKV